VAYLENGDQFNFDNGLPAGYRKELPPAMVVELTEFGGGGR